MFKKRMIALVLAMVMVITAIDLPMTLHAAGETPEAGTWSDSTGTLTTSKETVDGSTVLQIEKNSADETATLTNSTLYSIDKTGVQKDFELKWSMQYRSKESNSTVRLNITAYDESGNVLKDGEEELHISGDRVMLSREAEYSAWDELYTIATVPYETASVTYSIVVTGTKANIQVKGIAATVAPANDARTDVSKATGWTAQEVWYPEDETKDCYNQFRYFRIKVDLGDNPLKENTTLYIQLKADDSCTIKPGADATRLGNAFYVNGKIVYNESRINKNCKENGKEVFEYAVNTTNYDIAGKSEFYICIRVANTGSYAGLILQAYGLREQTAAYAYDKIVETNAETTKVSRLGMTELPEGYVWSSYYETGEYENWYQSDYVEDASWVPAEERGQVPYGRLGDVPFSWTYTDCQGFYTTDSSELSATVSANAGEQLVISKTAPARYFTGNIAVQLYKADDTSCNIVATIPTEVKLVSGKLNFTLTVPDYVPSGTYKARLQGARCLNDMYNARENLLATITVTNEGKEVVNSDVVSTENGIRLQVGDNYVSPIMYLQPSDDSYYSYEMMSGFKDTGVTLYTNFDGGLELIWTAEETISTSYLDQSVYKTLDLNPNAMIMVNLTMDAPAWWKTANPDELIKDSHGETVNKVSFASIKYRTEASAILGQIIDHLATSSYKHRIAGIRLSGGNTAEWLNYTNADGYIEDYSTAMQTAYGGTIPTRDERKAGTRGVLLDVATQKSVIQYNECLSQCMTDSLLAYANAVKTAMTTNSVNWVVGAYNAYMWQENTAGGIGKIHSTSEAILDSEAVDFISAPINYSERISGYATSYMTLPESIMAHGKLYIAEQDNRTVYADYDVVNGRTDALGKTYTVEDTVAQLTRDMTTDFVKGNGFWFYDMQGGWYFDDTLESAISTLKTEYDSALELNTSTNSEVAVFVGSESYDYLANDTFEDSNDSYKLLSQLYAAQRVELSRMGTSYDTYMIEDLCSEKVSKDWSQYKLSIILSPFELTEEERTAIQTNLQKNGNYVLWVYMPGISDGTATSAENISGITGMTVDMQTSNAYVTVPAKVSNALFGTTDAIYGTVYSTGNTTEYIPYVNDAEATQLATYTATGFTDKTAAAMKTITNIDGTTYTSVYSAVPNVSADSLRALCQAAGVHTYVENKDTVVETNATYICIYSQVAGEKTVALPEGAKCHVYDVFTGEKVTVAENNTFTASLAADETKLYRLSVRYDNEDFDGIMCTNPTFGEWTGAVPTGYSLNKAIATQNEATIDNNLYRTAKLTVDASKDNNAYLQYLVGLEAGKTYTVSFKARYSGAGNPYFYVYEQGKTDKLIDKGINSIIRDKWQDVEYTFTTTLTGTAKLQWRIAGDTTYGTGVYEITNICLEKEKEYTNDDFNGGLFTNANFKAWNDAGTLPTGYTNGGTAKFAHTEEDTANGTSSTVTIQLADGATTTSNTFMQYSVNMEAGITYEISFEGRFSGTGAPYFHVYENKSSSWTRVVNESCTALMKGKWATFSYEYTPEVTGQHLVRWVISGPDTTSAWEITNVYMDEKPCANLNFDGQLITNPVFDKWTDSIPTSYVAGKNTTVASTREVVDGQYYKTVTISATATENAGDAVRGYAFLDYYIELQPGVYRLNMLHKYTAGTQGSMYFYVYKGSTRLEMDNASATTAIATTTHESMQSMVREFTVTEAGTYNLRWRLVDTDTTATYEFTNVCLEYNPDYINSKFDGKLCTNPIFENWNETGTTPIGYSVGSKATAEHVRMGTSEGGISAVKITTTSETSSDGGNTYLSYWPTLEIGKTYKLTFDAYFKAATGTTGYGICKIYDSSKESQIVMTGSAGTWKTFSGEFTLVNRTNPEIRFRIVTPNLNDALMITNVRLEVVGYNNALINNGDFALTDDDGSYTSWTSQSYTGPGANLIENSDFGAETLNWTNISGYGSVALDNGEMKLTNYASAKYSKYVPVTSGKTYTISYYQRGVDAENVRVKPQIVERTATNGGLGTYTIDSSYTKPQETGGVVTATYTVKDDTAAYIEVRLIITNASGTAWIDDFKVYETAVNNTASVLQATLFSNGVYLTGGIGCSLQTTTAYNTYANATYLLKFNGAINNSSSAGTLSITNGSTTILSEEMQLGTSATAMKYLVPSPAIASYDIRFTLTKGATTAQLSIGDVSMVLNRGDFDDDGSIEDSDYSAMRKSLVGHKDAVNEAQYNDLTGDSKATVKDLVRMKLYEAGLK